jgi:hypothetical protein
MDVFDSADDAQHEGLDLRSDEIVANADELVEGLVLAQLQEDIDAVLVLKTVVQLHHVGVVQRFMQFNLVGQSQSGAVRLQLILENYLGRCLALGLHVLRNETVGKPALAEQSTFHVLSDHFLAIDSPYMLVDNVALLGLLLTLG